MCVMGFAPVQYPLSSVVVLTHRPKPYAQPDGDVTVALYKSGTTELYTGATALTATPPSGSATVQTEAKANQRAKALTLDAVGSPAFKAFERLLLTTPSGSQAEVIPYGVLSSGPSVTLDQHVPWDVPVGSTLARHTRTLQIAADKVTVEARNVRLEWSYATESGGPVLVRERIHLDFVKEPFSFFFDESDLEELDHTFGTCAAGADRWRPLLPGSTGRIWNALKTTLKIHPDLIRDRLALKRAVALDLLAAFHGRHTDEGKGFAEERDTALAAIVGAWSDDDGDQIQDEGETTIRYARVG